MKLKHTNPLGQVDVPLIQRQGDPIGEEGSGCLEPREVFEVSAAHGKHLLEQTGNYEPVCKDAIKAAKAIAAAKAAVLDPEPASDPDPEPVPDVDPIDPIEEK